MTSIVTLLISIAVSWFPVENPRVPDCSALFVTDTHGPADENAALVQALLEEDGISVVLHGGDVADAADLYGPWFDVPFRPVQERWGFWAASGNHDAADAETEAAFSFRFPVLPTRLPCGLYGEIYILPWSPTDGDVEWLADKVTSSGIPWIVLVIHRPVWPVDGGNAALREKLMPILPYIDIILSGHEHVSSDSVHDVGGLSVRQIIEVSGPKKYDCPEHPAVPCTAGQTAYWRLDFYADELRASRTIVP